MSYFDKIIIFINISLLNIFCLQNDIITLKVTNLYLLKNKTYEIIFKKKYVDWNGNHYYDNYGNWFGLVRIFQYKNDGLYQLVYFIFTFMIFIDLF